MGFHLMSRMYRFAMPACAFASAALLGMAQPAFATNGGGAPVGTASATTAEVGLDVKLLNAVDVPVEATLNRIDSPVSKGGSLLTVNVDGLHHGSPLSLLRADAGRTWATSDSHGSHAGVELVKADAHLPSLLLASLLQADLVKATADCPAGGRPTAAAEVAGHVKVLGIGVQLKVGGPTVVDVPLVGKVSLELSRTTVTDDSAAAAALRLSVEVNPLNIDVAKITGEVTLAQASCTKPAGQQGGGGGNGGGGNGGARRRPRRRRPRTARLPGAAPTAVEGPGVAAARRPPRPPRAARGPAGRPPRRVARSPRRRRAAVRVPGAATTRAAVRGPGSPRRERPVRPR
ncbi:SCO1860 family LAETG-anchored protein [Streptacidiphilus monticola]